MTASVEGRPHTRSRGTGPGGGSWGSESEEWNREDPGNRERLARGLGWFSLGLGLTQLANPRGVARMIGLRDDDEHRNAMVAVGMREIASGISILLQRRPTGAVWSRVGGDVMDLALLGRALNSRRNDRNRVAYATVAVIGTTVLDVLAAQRLGGDTNGEADSDDGATGRALTEHGIEVTAQITVNRPPEDVYAFWRNFENLPQFMAHLESVRVLDDRGSHWKANAPAGSTVEWDAEIVEDRPNERIAWRSVQGSVPNAGSVRFTPAPGGQGTEIHVALRYDPPVGKLGALIAKLFGAEPKQQVKGDLRRFKQVMELGEVVQSDASIHRGMHPAQPSTEIPRLAPNMEGATYEGTLLGR